MADPITIEAKFEDLIFTRNGNSNDLIVTGKDGQAIQGEETSVTISNFTEIKCNCFRWDNLYNNKI